MKRLGRSLTLLTMTLAACTVDVPPPPTAPPTSPATTVTVPASTTTTATTAPPTAAAPCIAGDMPFGDQGLIAAFGDETGGDASSIAGFRWSLEDPCERFVIDLATAGGSPAATLGRTTVEVRPGAGYIRITLPEEVRSTSIADTVVDTDLVAHAFVVKRTDERLHVDLHLDAPNGVRVRSFAAGSPARIVVDLVAAATDMPIEPPDRAAGVVLLAPGPGPAEYPLRVSGYARVPTGTVLVVLGPETQDAVAQTTTAAGSGEAWGEFSLTFSGGPSGTVELFAGSENASSGTLNGLRITLDLS